MNPHGLETSQRPWSQAGFVPPYPKTCFFGLETSEELFLTMSKKQLVLSMIFSDTGSTVRTV